MAKDKIKKKNKIPPAKVIITMGDMITQTQFSGKVSGVNLINGVLALMKDAQKMTGMQYKEIFAIVDEGLGAEVFRKKPAMRASTSQAGDDTEDHG